MLGSSSEADDAVQEAYLRALRYFDSFRGGNPKPWLLGIVRRAFFDWHAGQKRDAQHEEPLEPETHEQVADESLWAQSPAAGRRRGSHR